MLAVRVIELTLLVVGLLVAITSGYVLLVKRQPIASRRLNIHELGTLEGNLPHLKRVIVICNKVQKPQNSLASSVEKNFARGVKYTFLVSRSKAHDESRGYYQIFRTLASIALDKGATHGKIEDLVEILQLDEDWNDFPYIFYQLWDVAKNDWGGTLAYRGDMIREGIAENYSRVPPEFAHTIARSVLSPAPSNFQTDRELDLRDFRKHVVVPFQREVTTRK